MVNPFPKLVYHFKLIELKCCHWHRPLRREDLIIPELDFQKTFFGKFGDKSAWICDKNGYNSLYPTTRC